MFLFDSGYILFVLPALIFALYAQHRVSSTWATFARYPAAAGVTGAQVARQILHQAGLDDVRVDRIGTPLGDHYDPQEKVLRLSAGVYDSSSVAALGVAAHEVGHAIQHDTGYLALGIRNSLVPVANFSSQAAIPLFFLGFFFRWPSLMDIGIVVFFAAVVFQIITLPVEYNASGRALALLEDGGFLTREEMGPARQVLNAAALTYVAATAMAVAQLLRLLVLRDRRD
ncbi:MAG: zinc metallopeptidase [Firmicutes bacterium]|nr:zinc metallopeptidase [Bacillota bacterium]MCL5038288.1 zinc metallopeptidase [Bacillota bacterium]